MKIELPKNAWISNIDLTYCKEGYWNGAMMLQIKFSGAELDLVFATETFENVLKLPFPRRRIVRFSGLFNPNDSNLDTVVRAFKTYGFMTQAVTNGTRTFTWMDAIDWHIVRTERPLILMDCAEIWYTPPPVDPIVEPTIPPKNASALFLYIEKGHSAVATSEFITTAKYNWNLL